MNLRQLKSLCEIVDRGLSVSGAADATYRSQASVTRQIQKLELELGFELFVRRRNRLMSITPQCDEIVSIARRMLQDAENMRRVGKNRQHDQSGDFTIATTHTHARYVLPAVIRRFVEKYPQVRLSLRQGNPSECCQLVAQGKADLALCSDPRELPQDVAEIRCYKLFRSVITPARHPLLRAKPLTLEALARYPLITYDDAFSGRWIVNRTFADKGLSPHVVLSAVDADVSKVYVEMGLGIAIFVTVAFDPAHDVNLRRIDARHLFKPSYLNFIVRRHSYLRGYMYDFIQMFAPKVDRATVEEALFRSRQSILSTSAVPELDSMVQISK